MSTFKLKVHVKIEFLLHFFYEKTVVQEWAKMVHC